MYEVRGVGDGGVGVMGYNHGGSGVGVQFLRGKGYENVGNDRCEGKGCRR